MAVLSAAPSIEITSRDLKSLADARHRLAPGTRISIAFLPKDDPAGIVAASRQVTDAGYLPVPHIPARRIASPAALHDFLERLAGEASVRDLFVIAGDPAKPAGAFQQSLDILSDGVLSRLGYRSVGFAGHPEGHPAVAESVLLDALAAKLRFARDAGLATEVVTQFCFDADQVLVWLGKVRAIDADVRIRVGIPGPTDTATLIKFAARCGVGASKAVLKKYGLSLTRLFARANPDAFVAEIIDRAGPDGGPLSFHVYPFGGVSDSADWIDGFACRSHLEEIRA